MSIKNKYRWPEWIKILVALLVIGTIVAIVVMSLSGCAEFRYTDPNGVSLTWQSFGKDVEVGSISAGKDPNGNIYIKAEAVKSEASQVIQATAAAIKETIGAVK